MNLLNKPIEDVIQSLYDGIKSKKEIIANFRKDYKLNDEKEQIIKIARLKLVDFLDEFEITVSQSLQAILTLQAELCNLKENKEGKLINRTILDSKIDNSQLNISNINNTYSSNRKNIIPKNEKEEVKKEIEEISDNINKTSDLINNIILNETKLNFDYSKLASKINNNNNESELSLITNSNNNNYIKEKNNNILKEEERLIPESDISEIMQDDNLNNRNDFNNISISSIKPKNNENKKNKSVSSDLILNYKNEPEPEIEQIKIPIRQSLRQIISKGNNNNQLMNNTNNIINTNLYKEEKDNTINEFSIGSKREIFQNKIKKVEKENKIKNLISKINAEESYKVYLGNKYGGGHYNIFLKKLNNNEIDFNSIEKEVKIITDLVNTDRNIRKQRNNNFKNNNSMLNNSGIKNKKNHSRRNSKENNNSFNNENPNEYIEPINFANFLRGDDNALRKKRSKSKKRNSKEKNINY